MCYSPSQTCLYPWWMTAVVVKATSSSDVTQLLNVRTLDNLFFFFPLVFSPCDRNQMDSFSRTGQPSMSLPLKTGSTRTTKSTVSSLSPNSVRKMAQFSYEHKVICPPLCCGREESQDFVQHFQTWTPLVAQDWTSLVVMHMNSCQCTNCSLCFLYQGGRMSMGLTCHVSRRWQLRNPWLMWWTPSSWSAVPVSSRWGDK